MNMKKLLACTLCILMLAACLTGCGSKGTTLDAVQKSGKLVIATSPDFPPFEMLDGSEVVGIEIDLMQLVCQKLGVTLEIRQMDFDSVLAGVQVGKFDAGVSGITVTPGREKNMLFTVPYCLAAQAIVVPEGSAIASKADLAGKTIAVQTGTTAEEFCMAEGYAVNSYAANTDAETALLSGKVDAWVIDDLTAAEMVKIQNAGDGQKLVILSEAMTAEPYAIGFCKGSESLVAAVSEIIEALVADGTVQAIFEKYDAPYTAPQS